MTITFDENTKPAGRPRTGVTAEPLPHVRSQVADWIEQHRLGRWLQEDSGDFRFKAEEVFEQLPSIVNTEKAEAVDGEPLRRPGRKTVQLTMDVRDRLSAFANRHSLTINEAVAELLSKADG